jgi:hypothetical protein
MLGLYNISFKIILYYTPTLICSIMSSPRTNGGKSGSGKYLQKHQNSFFQQACTSKKLFAKDPQEHQNSFFQQSAKTRQQKTVL